MSTPSLRVRLILATVASLLAGAAATVAGAVHLVTLHRQGTEASGGFETAVWTTLVMVVVIANATGLTVVVLTTRALGSSVKEVGDAILSLTALAGHDDTLVRTPVADVYPQHTRTELIPLHDAIGVARSQLRAMLDRVRMERDRTGAIIDTVFASVFAVDGGGRIIHANAAAAAMFDRPMHALTGVVLSDMIETESLQMHVDEFGTVTFRANTPQARFTTTFRVFGRRAFPADVCVTPLALEGQRAWAVFVHDLSVQVQREAELDAARIASDEANRAKTTFLARIGAEFRAPLNATITFSKAVLRSRSSQLSDRDRLYLEKVLGSTSHLITLVCDILDLAQIESGTLALQPAPIDVTVVVQSVLEHFDDQVAGRPVLLERGHAEGALHASIDPQRLRQVITHLVSNAVKFTARGSITVTVLRSGGSDTAAAIVVRDTGIGIPLERQSHIFDLFAQAEPDSTLRYGGSGLGLALSKRLATEMGCMLSVESTPGAGSVFTLSFMPAVPVTTSAPRALASGTG